MKQFTKKQMVKLRLYYRSALEAEDRYRENLSAIETVMQGDVGIEDLEFFITDSWLVGIGTEGRDYELVQGEDIEKEGT